MALLSSDVNDLFLCSRINAFRLTDLHNLVVLLPGEVGGAVALLIDADVRRGADVKSLLLILVSSCQL